jgi:triacylglycerol lipase
VNPKDSVNPALPDAVTNPTEPRNASEAKAEIRELIKLVSQPLTGPIREQSLLRQSLLFAELSYLSYYNPDHLVEAVRNLGLDDFTFLEQANAQAYVFSTQYDCVVVFRGTQPHELDDIKADINAVMIVAETVGRVHRGFKGEVDDLWEQLEKILKDNTKPLWFTGHSLGGAMATIAAGRCVLSPIPSNPEALFSFGSPRVGCRRYINFVKINHYRWVNNNDIVTRMPPRWLGYTHSGRELYLNSNGSVARYSTLRKISDRWRGFLTSLVHWKVDHFSDHLLTLYIQYLHQAIQDEESGKAKPLRKGMPKQPTAT